VKQQGSKKLLLMQPLRFEITFDLAWKVLIFPWLLSSTFCRKRGSNNLYALAMLVPFAKRVFRDNLLFVLGEGKVRLASPTKRMRIRVANLWKVGNPEIKQARCF
jgi:hypothetical protein